MSRAVCCFTSPSEQSLSSWSSTFRLFGTLVSVGGARGLEESPHNIRRSTSSQPYKRSRRNAATNSAEQSTGSGACPTEIAPYGDPFGRYVDMSLVQRLRFDASLSAGRVTCFKIRTSQRCDRDDQRPGDVSAMREVDTRTGCCSSTS